MGFALGAQQASRYYEQYFFRHATPMTLTLFACPRLDFYSAQSQALKAAYLHSAESEDVRDVRVLTPALTCSDLRGTQ